MSSSFWSAVLPLQRRGAPVVTQDLDILYRTEPSNIIRLKAALDGLEAVARDDPRRLPFAIRHLESRERRR
jgi:hypothetical protein